MKRIAFFVVILFTATAFSQDYTIPESFPGVEYENLAPMIGKWKVSYQMFSEKKSDDIYGNGINEIYFQFNGMMMVIHNVSTQTGMRYESFSYISYDKVNAEYYLFRYDNIVYSRIHLAGKYNEKTRTLTFEGTILNKEKFPVKITYYFERDNKIVGEVFLDEGTGMKQTYKEILIKAE